MLPEGYSKPLGLEGRLRKALGAPSATSRRNAVSQAYGDALRRFAERGWIDRGREFLRIRERGRLLDYARRGQAEVPAHFIELDRAVALLTEELAPPTAAPRPPVPPRVLEQRRRELLAVQRMMAGGVQGAHWSGRGSVRFVPKGKAL